MLSTLASQFFIVERKPHQGGDGSGGDTEAGGAGTRGVRLRLEPILLVAIFTKMMTAINSRNRIKREVGKPVGRDRMGGGRMLNR